MDDALSCLYERLLAEHVTSWYQHLAQDEEFLQQLRLVLRWVDTRCTVYCTVLSISSLTLLPCSHVSRTTLTRLARLDLTDLLLREAAPHLAAHLDTFLWALHHARAEHAPEDTGEISEARLQRTWLTFVGGGLHPALASREAETEHLESLASRIVPLALASHHCQSPVSSSVATALLANVVLQPLLG